MEEPILNIHKKADNPPKGIHDTYLNIHSSCYIHGIFKTFSFSLNILHW